MMFQFHILLIIIASIIVNSNVEFVCNEDIVSVRLAEAECQDNCDRLCRYGREADWPPSTSYEIRKLRGCKQSCGRLRCR